MSTTTNLGLFKHDNPATNTDEFNVDKALNENWDKLDTAIGKDRERITTLETDNTTNMQDITNIKAKNTEQDKYIVELEAENSRLREDLNGLPKGQASGESIDLSDSAEMRCELKISGNSRQETRNGKNLFKPTLQTTTLNGITCTNNGDGTYTLNGTATDDISLDIFPEKTIPSGSYKVIGCPSGGSATTYYLIARFDGVWGNKDTGNGAIFNSTSFGKLSITIRSGVVCNNFIFKPMITSDTSLTYNDYEQYGASPSPDYPSENESCGDNGSINEVICNKNLLKIVDGTYTNQGITTIIKDSKIKSSGTTTTTYADINNISSLFDINIKSGCEYTFSRTKTSEYRLWIRLYNSASDIQDAMIAENSKSVTFIANSNYNKCYLFYTNFKADKTLSIDDFQVMIAEGSTVTDYEEHKSQTYTIPTQQPFRAIRNIRDTFIKKNNKWYKRHYIARKIFDGSETWNKQGGNNICYSLVVDNMYGVSGKARNVVSNYFNNKYTNHEVYGTNVIGVANTTNRLFVGLGFNSILNTTNLFTNWLQAQYQAGTPVYVDFILAEPLDIECTEEQNTILDKIENEAKTYKNVTHIYSTDEISPNVEVTYKKDIDTMITNIEQAILSQGGNI